VPRMALAQKTEHPSRRVERQELQIAEQAQREQMSKALLAHLRQVDLGTVIAALGGDPDPSARGRWSLGGEPVSVDGDRWYNHARQQSATGAIELIQHATGYTERQATAWLSHEVGADVAVVAAARHARSIAEREPPPPFQAPEPDPQHWPQVRAYLIEQRGLPSRWIDYLHDRGTVYADRRANAVFLRQNDQGEATGAYLRGTWPGNSFSGLAAGTRRDAGWFRVTLQRRSGSHDDRSVGRPVLILAESPIDALSVLEMHRRSAEGRECGPVTVLSTDGAGTLPDQAIRQTLDQGGIVRVATGNDQAGERIWQTIQEKYPEPQVVRDGSG
jgi:Protein of unknown function (DUF3991)/Toprim-like